MTRRRIIIASVAALPMLLAGCEIGPKQSTQTGYRGTGIDQVVNPGLVKAQVPIPANVYETPGDTGPRASETYQNVKVLGGVSTDRFNHFMAQMNNWVAPQAGKDPNEVGCNYCHNPNNMASDEKYTKVVARRMIQMTQRVNQDWKTHVAETGVTCYTCHRGNNIPANVWFAPKDRKYAGGVLGDLAGQNIATKEAGLSSLPFDPFTPYLKDAAPIRVNGTEAMAGIGKSANRASVKQTEFTYSLMAHMSESLGVNCTYCHNTRNFQSWEQSRPQRVTAWYGIRMARDLNNDYMTPLTKTFPPERLGPKGDVAKVNCTTCHQGAYKPLYGAAMAKDYPELQALAKP